MTVSVMVLAGRPAKSKFETMRVTDGLNKLMNAFDETALPPQLVASLSVCDRSGLITFTLQGDYARRLSFDLRHFRYEVAGACFPTD
ncbi:MAG: hypothetical protein H6821_00980 [Planctomycetaceae bacterium]|nr:hypothetical protein [Planctomycetales bacterium]MCB9872724.1 hypothetical protein [Planctomycetaceae bacterium]MCB9926210.1 hypothetical protein [Planctomycetaceae bacterium]